MIVDPGIVQVDFVDIEVHIVVGVDVCVEKAVIILQTISIHIIVCYSMIILLMITIIFVFR